MQNAIRNIAYLGGWTNTTGALRVACTEIFNTANGDRSDVPNVIVLITDGVPNIDVHLLAGEVARCKARGIRILGVGVTNQVSFLISNIATALLCLQRNYSKVSSTVV